MGLHLFCYRKNHSETRIGWHWHYLSKCFLPFIFNVKFTSEKIENTEQQKWLFFFFSVIQKCINYICVSYRRVSLFHSFFQIKPQFLILFNLLLFDLNIPLHFILPFLYIFLKSWEKNTSKDLWVFMVMWFTSTFFFFLLPLPKMSCMHIVRFQT